MSSGDPAASTMSAPTNQPTPPQEESSNSVFASHVPHDIKYDCAFEDDLMQLILNQSHLSPNYTEAAVQQQDVAPETLPVINEDDLPLSIADPRRIYPSPLPGIRLTHPGGYIEGGPGLDPEMDTFVEDFMDRNPDISSQSSEAALRKAVRREIDRHFELLKDRSRARQKAYEHNERIDKELKIMSDSHSMEMKINRKLADERRARKEAKEKRRKGEK